MQHESRVEKLVFLQHESLSFFVGREARCHLDRCFHTLTSTDIKALISPKYIYNTKSYHSSELGTIADEGYIDINYYI